MFASEIGARGTADFPPAVPGCSGMCFAPCQRIRLPSGVLCRKAPLSPCRDLLISRPRLVLSASLPLGTGQAQGPAPFAKITASSESDGPMKLSRDVPSQLWGQAHPGRTLLSFPAGWSSVWCILEQHQGQDRALLCPLLPLWCCHPLPGR